MSSPDCFALCLPYRTESVAEKMLTNWFTFLLYKFLKVSLGGIADPLLGQRWVPTSLGWAVCHLGPGLMCVFSLQFPPGVLIASQALVSFPHF